MANRPVTFEIKKCHNCGGPATFSCADCTKPVCGKCQQVAQHRDKASRCTPCYKVFVKRYGDGIK